MKEKIILLIAIFLPILSFIVIYFISKDSPCSLDYHNNKCGYVDICGNVGKKCPSGHTCNGVTCKDQTSPQTFIEYNQNNKEKLNYNIDEKLVKGICYFDIDDTLTTAKGDPEQIIQTCIDNNFAVGIITASARTIDHICFGESKGGIQNANWMSNKLCKQFRENNGRMFNSLVTIAGQNLDSFIKENNYGPNLDYGHIKGISMIRGKDFYPHLSYKDIVLFDDNSLVIEQVKQINPELQVECSHPKCNGSFLTKELVDKKIKSMINNK